MIEFVEGNLLESGCDVIVHQVNCQKVMGAGIAKQIRQKWPQVYYEYCDNIEYCYENGICRSSYDFLGMINWTEIDNNKYIVNFYSQDEYYPRDRCHTDYRAFTDCCITLKNFITGYNLDKANIIIGFPYKIGCGLAGGDWSIVSKIIEEELSDYNVKIYKFDR